jgi:transcription-repair coupling factor (superfamily II helicase)
VIALAETTAPPAPEMEGTTRQPRGSRLLLARAVEGLEIAWLASRLRHGEGSCALHIARDGTRIPVLARLAAFFAPAVEVVELPAWDCLPHDRI